MQSVLQAVIKENTLPIKLTVGKPCLFLTAQVQTHKFRKPWSQAIVLSYKNLWNKRISAKKKKKKIYDLRTRCEVITAALTSPMAGGYVIGWGGLSETPDPGRAMGRGRKNGYFSILTIKLKDCLQWGENNGGMLKVVVFLEVIFIISQHLIS